LPRSGRLARVDLQEVPLIEERKLDAALLDQLLDVVRPQRADPLQPPDPAQRLLDPLGGDHPPVAHQHQSFDVKAVTDLVHLRRQRRRVGRVALEDLDSHRTALGVAQKPVDDLRIAGSAVAAVAELRQNAVAAGVEAGADVVEHQGALPQVPCGQRVLDAPLPRQKPVHGLVQPPFVVDLDAQLHRETGGGALLHERAGGGELGARLDDPRHDQGEHQGALLGGSGSQKPLQTDLPEGPQHGRHVSVGEGAQDLKAPAARPRWQIAAEPGTDGLDEIGGQVGEVTEGLVLDLASLAIATPQEVGFVELALVAAPGGGYVDCT